MTTPTPTPGSRTGGSSFPGVAPRPRISFSTPVASPSPRRVSQGGVALRRTITGGTARSGDEEAQSTPVNERPPIPSALPAGTTPGAYVSPLPVLPMVVLSIAMLGEFLSANVSQPFLLFMVEKIFLVGDAEADVGYWTGILVSMFFLTQFLTSLLWAAIAERHGQRLVLFVSLLGSSLSCFAFGTSTSLSEALAIRLLQGIFGGSIGVARSSIASITDPTNEGRAYAILGFCWGLGGVAGAIIGGTFERPAEKWPGAFQNLGIFVKYPYLFPCTIAASITFLGAVLSLFLARDGGSREGAIRLLPEKDNVVIIEEETSGVTDPGDTSEAPKQGSLRKKLSRRFSQLFNKREPPTDGQTSGDPVPLSSAIPIQRRNNRVFSRTSRIHGSAYGYTGARSRAASTALSLRRTSTTSMRRRRESGNVEDANPSTTPVEGANFAQRLLMANEMAVTNIADLWVAAAINVENDEVFFSDEEGDDEPDLLMDSDIEEDTNDPTMRDAPREREFLRRMAARRIGGRLASPYATPTRSQLASFAARESAIADSPVESVQRAFVRPKLSRAFSSSSHIPSIYANTGVKAPAVPAEPQSPSAGPVSDPFGEAAGGLDTITEGQQHVIVAEPATVEKPPSLLMQLPLMVICHYGLLALHTTTHDQVFLSYLVSKFEAGGLNLNAAHFAQLIALMCLAQIAYQFYLYPNIGPPRGRFSHLAMFRIGTLLFIPAYISVTLYRFFASAQDDGNFLLMTLLTISTALRYCGSTFCYTAISILLNYMSPPHVVGLANGLAQSIVSLARFAGPVLGGYIWSVSVQDNPNGYPVGFLVCAGACAVTVLTSFIIR